MTPDCPKCSDGHKVRMTNVLEATKSLDSHMCIACDHTFTPACGECGEVHYVVVVTRTLHVDCKCKGK